MRNYLLNFSSLFLVFVVHYAAAQTYRTSWDNAAQRTGWSQYQLGIDSNSTWAYTPVAVLTGEVLIHSAPPSSNMNVTDNWIVSPAFNFSAGGSIDSLIVNLSGVEVPNANDRLGIYLVQGSQDPTVSGSWQLLKQFDSTEYMLNGGTYQNIDSIMIPPTSGTSYLAFRYKTINSQFDALFDALQVTANYPNATNDVHKKNSAVKIYPNPSSGECVLEILDKNIILKSVLVLDAMGRKVESAYRNHHIDLSSASKGVYFVTIKTSQEEVFIKKLIVN